MVDMMCGMPLQQRRAREQGSVGEGVQAAGGRRRLFSSIQKLRPLCLILRFVLQ